MKTNKVVIDTNAFIYAVQKKKDIFENLQKLLGSFQLIVLDAVKKELGEKAERAKKLKKTKSPAKIALALLSRANIVKYENKEKNTDDLILQYAKENDAFVLTMDKELKQRLKKDKIKIIGLEVFD